ncbi:MAG: ATP-binding protein [Neomegalonema sp.]|nr:ATP-binding protein [Neomegalonema sp.]
MAVGTLIFFCGKMGAGKSTRAQEIATEQNAVLLVEDAWLAALYPGQITSLADYVQYSERLKPQIKQLAQSILRAGVDVVMDFPANTRPQRRWFREIFEESGAPHQLIYIAASDATCLARITKRRGEQPERAATDTPEMFARLAQHFSPPDAAEAFEVTTVAADAG